MVAHSHGEWYWKDPSTGRWVKPTYYSSKQPNSVGHTSSTVTLSEEMVEWWSTHTIHSEADYRRQRSQFWRKLGKALWLLFLWYNRFWLQMYIDMWKAFKVWWGEVTSEEEPSKY